MKPGKAPWRRRIGAVLTVLIFAVALWFLHKTAQKYDPDQVFAQLRATPLAVIALSILFGMGSYLCLGGFDWLATRYVGARVATPRVLFTSFVSHAITHSTGFAALTGGAVRYRMYVAAGLTPMQVAGIVAFCGITFALGAWSLVATTLLVEPTRLAPAVNLPPDLLRGVGVALALVLAAYFTWASLMHRPVRVFGRSIEVPGPRLTLLQITVAAADLSLAAASIWILLPEGKVSLPAFVGIYVAANLSGLLAHVPGGLGVFDAVILVLTPGVPGEAVLGALLIYRLVYNLLPLLMGVTLLAIYELLDRVPSLHRAFSTRGEWIGELAAPMLSALTFVAGAAFVTAAAMPGAFGTDAARYLSSLSGAVLMIQARGLNRAFLAALVSCALMLAVASAAAAFNGPRPLALAAGLLTLALFASWPLFAATGLRLALLTAPWAAAATSVLAAALWLGLYLSRDMTARTPVWGPVALAAAAVLLYGLVSCHRYFRGQPGRIQA